MVQVLSPIPSVNLFVCLSVCVSDRCIVEKTADWIRKPFGTYVDRLGPRMRQVDGGEYRYTGRGNFGVYVRRPIVTNGDFVALLCKNV